MQPDRGQHPEEDALELYSMGKLSDPGLSALEEHLLACPECQQRLGEMDSYVRAMRDAAAKLREESAAEQAESFRGLLAVLHGLRPAAVALGVGVVLLGLFWLVASWRPVGSEQTPVAISLQAIRGGEPAAGARAPADRPLLLEIDLTGLPSQQEYALEVAGSTGEPLWQAVVRSASGRIRVRPSRTFRPGAYWVRLFSDGGKTDLLREFSLRVE